MFIIEDNIVKPSPEILLIPIFKQIWDSDKTSKKDKAMITFAYIEFTLSPKKSNPFSGYQKEVRPAKILQALRVSFTDLHENTEEAMAVYEEFLQNSSPSLAYYNSTLEAADKLKNFFSTFNLNDRIPKTGAPVYKPSDITRALQDTQKIVLALEELREKIEKELMESTKNRGNRSINTFEKRPT